MADPSTGCSRRSLADPTDLAHYLAAAPTRTPLRELARIAGVRWAFEETFQTAKNEAPAVPDAAGHGIGPSPRSGFVRRSGTEVRSRR